LDVVVDDWVAADVVADRVAADWVAADGPDVGWVTVGVEWVELEDEQPVTTRATATATIHRNAGICRE